eukprot:4894831-Pleurochrysis_carterae.AAC.1
MRPCVSTREHAIEWNCLCACVRGGVLVRMCSYVSARVSGLVSVHPYASANANGPAYERSLALACARALVNVRLRARAQERGHAWLSGVSPCMRARVRALVCAYPYVCPRGRVLGWVRPSEGARISVCAGERLCACVRQRALASVRPSVGAPESALG